MANEKPNPLDSLLEPGFGYEEPALQARATEVKPKLAAPAAAMTVKVKIDDIQPYDQNPRRAENEKYEEIRESIRDIGLQQQISITKRPNDDYYIVRSGGNTRLKALKELYAETNEEKFGQIECRFVPYTNELELLSLHVMENEQRSAMLFIDIALAAKNFRIMFEKEQGQAISLRRLANEMKQLGWVINNQHLTYYMYATEIADELPIAFSQGLGRRIVIEIKSLENHVKQWADEKSMDLNKCLQYFRNALKMNDMKSFSVEQAEKDLIDTLSKRFSVKYNEVRNDFILIKSKGTLVSYAEEEETAGHSHINNASTQVSTTPENHNTFASTATQNTHMPQTGTGHPNHSAIASDLNDLKTYTPPELVIPKAVETENFGSTPKDIERNKLRHKLRDAFNLVLITMQKFDPAFTVTTDDYILISKLEPRVMADASLDQDEIAVWYTLYIRSEMLRIAINGREDRSNSRKDLVQLSDLKHLNGHEHLPGVVSNHLIQQIVSNYSDELIHIYYGSLKKEIIDIYKALPAIDRMIRDYLAYFI